MRNHSRLLSMVYAEYGAFLCPAVGEIARGLRRCLLLLLAESGCNRCLREHCKLGRGCQLINMIR